WYCGNADAGGFYRVLHDAANRAALREELASVLTAVERLALAGDQWALVRANRTTVESFLDIADALGDETDYDVLDGIAGPLDVVDEQVVPPDGPVQAALRGWLARRIGRAIERLGGGHRPSDGDYHRLHRSAL